jgi:hypothetical protein
MMKKEYFLLGLAFCKSKPKPLAANANYELLLTFPFIGVTSTNNNWLLIEASLLACVKPIPFLHVNRLRNNLSTSFALNIERQKDHLYWMKRVDPISIAKHF